MNHRLNVDPHYWLDISKEASEEHDAATKIKYETDCESMQLLFSLKKLSTTTTTFNT